MTEHGLEPELVWQSDGHLSEEALVALADAELDLLPESAQLHAGDCEACAERLGEMALLSARAHEAFTALADAPVAAPAPVRFPVFSVILAVLLAAVGLLPTLRDSLRELMSLPAAALQGLLVLSKSAGVLMRHGFEGPVWIAAWCGAFVLLALAGLVISRVAPRQLAWKGVTR
ncbi:MAG TPA: hypothetical protein PKA88_15750 [Polyangiaceae bacterium]|nr:hypothetical protein [Polyangiaceae bacterium]